MLSHFLLVLWANLALMFVIDLALNRRWHRIFTRHFIASTIGLGGLIALCHFYPVVDLRYIVEREGNPILKLAIALLLFDAFVFFMHKYVEHGLFWRWHKSHHKMVNDHDLTYYSPAPVEPEETIYYTGIQLAIAALVGLSPLEVVIFVTWVFQQGAYVHQKGLPELPWPLLSGKHHRTHHFKAKRYYSGLFLIWDKTEAIDPRAITGFPVKQAEK